MGGLYSKSYPPFETAPKCVTDRFMGHWFVIGVKPTPFETTCSNAVEIYTRVENKNHDIDIDFQYNKKNPITSPLKHLNQKGWIRGEDKNDSSNWTISPFGPIKLPYPIIELDDENYQYTVIGNPQRSYVWIMARTPVMDDTLYNTLKERLVEKHSYDLQGLRKVPQKWTREERAKRNLENVIPDDLLVD
jgi:apolipoprotein D and lipocalin family protein